MTAPLGTWRAGPMGAGLRLRETQETARRLRAQRDFIEGRLLKAERSAAELRDELAGVEEDLAQAEKLYQDVRLELEGQR